jgi:2,3-diketo-5-methylthio-1-phosphopentane phosphatase
VLVLDFDGTLALADVGDAICERFAPPEWRDIDAKWEAGTLTLPEAQVQMWRLVRATAEEMRAALAHEEIGALRPGLDDLLDAAGRSGVPVILASGGFDIYVEALLGSRLAVFAQAFYNVCRPSTDGARVEFPHAALACERVAVCKGKVCDEARDHYQAREVLFVGDGASDVCAIGHADRLFAVAGGKLERLAETRGVATLPFEDLADIARVLEGR